MGKNLYEERPFHSVEGMIWIFIAFSSFLSKTCFMGFVLLPFVGFFLTLGFLLISVAK